jgi:hypothetical protein
VNIKGVPSDKVAAFRRLIAMHRQQWLGSEGSKVINLRFGEAVVKLRRHRHSDNEHAEKKVTDWAAEARYKRRTEGEAEVLVQLWR